MTNSYRHSGAGDEGIGVDVEITVDHVRAEISDRGEGIHGLSPCPHRGASAALAVGA